MKENMATIEAGKISIVSNGSVSEISIDEEYFRPRFKEIILANSYYFQQGEYNKCLEELLYCLNHAEAK